MIAAATPRPASGSPARNDGQDAQARKVAAGVQRAQKEPELDVEATKHRLAYIWESENILDLWVQSWDKMMAGEHRNAKLLYLIATSRMFDNRCISPSRGRRAVANPKSEGKCWSSFLPNLSSASPRCSERALLYHKGDFDHKILSMAEAHGFQEKELQDMLLRELMTEGILPYPVVQKVAGQLVTQVIIKHGPVASWSQQPGRHCILKMRRA